MRVLTLNLQHGLDAQGRPTDPAALATALAGIRTDIALLQEADRGQQRSNGVDQPAVVGDALGLPHVRFAGVLGDLRRRSRSDGERWGQRPGPGYGLAIASRWPIVSWFVARLPRLRRRYPALGPAGLRWARDERRGVLAAVLAHPSGPVSVACTHLSTLTPVAAVQLRRALAALSTLPAPRLLGGDLNLGARTVSALAGPREQPLALTHPARAPIRQIDHLLLDGARVRTAAALALPISDHRGLLVEVELTGTHR